MPRNHAASPATNTIKHLSNAFMPAQQAIGLAQFDHSAAASVPAGTSTTTKAAAHHSSTRQALQQHMRWETRALPATQTQTPSEKERCRHQIADDKKTTLQSERRALACAKTHAALRATHSTSRHTSLQPPHLALLLQRHAALRHVLLCLLLQQLLHAAATQQQALRRLLLWLLLHEQRLGDVGGRGVQRVGRDECGGALRRRADAAGRPLSSVQQCGGSWHWLGCRGSAAARAARPACCTCRSPRRSPAAALAGRKRSSQSTGLPAGGG